MPVVNDGLLHVADLIRGLAGPTAFGVRKSQLSIVQRTWYDGAIGTEGGFEEAVLVLPQIYKFKPVTTREIMASGGQYEMGDIRVGPITPTFNDAGVSGGFSEAQLHPTDPFVPVVHSGNDVETIYRVTGDHAGDYQIVAMESWRALSRYLVLRRRISTPSVP